MALRFAILALLGKRSRHGYALREGLDDLIGAFWPVNQGQVYATLSRLTSAGQIEPADDEDEDGDPVRQVHALAPLGREALRDWLGRPTLALGRRSELLARIVLHARSEDRAQLGALIAAQRRRCAALAQSIRGVRRSDSSHRPDRSSTRTALLHIEAELTWLDRLESELLGVNRSRRP